MMRLSVSKLPHLLLACSTMLTCVEGSHGQQMLGSNIDKLHHKRSYVPKDVASKLYDALLAEGAPKNDEKVDTRVFDFKGDAGERGRKQEISTSLALKNIINGQSPEKESVVFRIEYLTGKTYNRSKELINNVVPNRVLEDDGTIHLYMSSPGAAALDNHTDVTDIFVLQLKGEKDWFLCEETGFEKDSFRKKLNTCSKYSEKEVKGMHCDRLTLYPGDALFLPRRVVHSARAPAGTSSAHLTFGFAVNQCSEYDQERYIRNSRKLQLPEPCNRDDGGIACDESCDQCSENCDENCPPCNAAHGGSNCDEGCNLSCNSGCDANCPTTCNADQGGQQCNGNCNTDCDGSCDSSCDTIVGSCDSGCDSDCNGNCNTNCLICPEQCNADAGGTDCDEECDQCTTSCNEGCPPCNANDGGTGCDADCESCDASCDQNCPGGTAGSPSPSPICFPGDAVVEVQGKGPTRMDSLKVGDAVLAGDGGYYSKVYSFAHYAPHVMAEFVQIEAENLDKPLEISAEHMLYMYQQGQLEQQHLVPAGMVQVGDFLVVPQKQDGSSSAAQVKSIRKVKRRGLYAPYTTKGNLVVNGVLASSYVALQDFDSLTWTAQGWVNHAMNAPLRVACHFELTWFCPQSHGDENYDAATGLSANVMLQLRTKALFYDPHVRIVQIGFLFGGGALFMALEQLMLSGQARLIAALLGYLAWKLVIKKKIQNRNKAKTLLGKAKAH